jgi:hypothetical protein
MSSLLIKHHPLLPFRHVELGPRPVDEDVARKPAEMAMPNRLVQLTLEHERVLTY